MADDVTFQTAAPATPPSGTVVATDDVGGKHYQRIKVDLGADGAAAPLTAGQKAKANSVPVTLASDEDLLAKLDTLHADVDGLETLVGATNTALASVDGHVDGLETAVAATNAKLDTVHADVDGLETAVAATNTKLDTLHTDSDGVETLLTAIDGHVDGLESVEGTSTDAAVVSDANGTISGKLRGLVKILADVWDSVNHGLKLGAGTQTIGAVNPPALALVGAGEIQGATSATQCPTLACKLVKLKASYDNVGRVYLGGSGVTKANGSDDTTTGLQLSASEETGWLPITNLNQLYRITDNAGDDLTFLALG